MAKPFLAATLIVKDECGDLPGCLESLQGLVDEVVVYDTGSTDGTQELARAAGARVEQGYWDGDFARARNAALAMTRATWALAIDADERAVFDARALRNHLQRSNSIDLYAVRIHNVSASPSGEGYDHPAPRLLRRERTTWTSPLHERPVRRDGRMERSEPLDPALLRLEHLGYAQLEDVVAKVERNVEIAQAELDALVEQEDRDPREVAYALLNLGRSCVGAGRGQQAVEALETLRELFPGTTEAVVATDTLACFLLDRNDPELADAAASLADELRRHGVSSAYCNFLVARALMVHGRYDEALGLLRPITELYDGAHRKLSDGVVLEARGFAAGMAGRLDEAALCLAGLMAGHGQIGHRPAQLVQILGSGPAEYVAGMLLAADQGYLSAVLDSLDALDGRGPEIAALVREMGEIRLERTGRSAGVVSR